jgi:hypothetical protein
MNDRKKSFEFLDGLAEPRGSQLHCCRQGCTYQAEEIQDCSCLEKARGKNIGCMPSKSYNHTDPNVAA